MRPMNIVAAMTYLAASGSSAVSPVDRPTVAKAETTSKSTCSIGASVIRLMVTVEIATIVAPHATTESATRCTSLGMRRPNACTDGRPFASENTARARTPAS